jgi:ubiquinone/menaquinone biosynthesis C-methylase UbiE
MSWLMAAVYDRVMSGAEAACLGDWRRELIAPLAGEVLEVGAGTGVNVVHYGRDVTRLVLAEPEPNMRRRLARHTRLAHAEISDASLERLPWPDASFDAVVCTLVLCSVPHVDRAAAEIHRVLRPGGTLAFIEHCAADEGSGRLKWQHRIEPLWSRIAGNCHVTRHPDRALRAAGFDLAGVERTSIQKALPWVRPSIRGLARK